MLPDFDSLQLTTDIQGFGYVRAIDVTLVTPAVTLPTPGSTSSVYSQSTSSQSDDLEAVIEGLVRVSDSNMSEINNKWLAISGGIFYRVSEGYDATGVVSRTATNIIFSAQYRNNTAGASVNVPSITYTLRLYVFAAPFDT